MQNEKRLIVGAILSGMVLLGAAATAVNAQAAAGRRAGAKREAPAEADIAASQLLSRAEELVSAGEADRGVKMLETVLEQYPASGVRFKAYLALGKYYLGTHEQTKAIGYLRNLRTLENAEHEVPENMRDSYLEALYLMGVAYFDMRQYAAAF